VRLFEIASASMRRLWALAAFAMLGACSYPDFGPTFTEDAKTLQAETFECCFDPEKFYPAPLVEIAFKIGSKSGPSTANTFYGDYYETGFPGTLTGKTEAAAAIVSHLRPLDIMVVGSTSYQLGRMVPGRFTHAVVYIGTEAELRAAGMWHLPELVPYHDEIRAGKTIIQSASPDVHLMTPDKAFERDRVLAIRPSLSASERRVAMRRLLGAMGKPFNFNMAIDPTGETFACTSLIDYAMPSLGFQRRSLYGVETVMPDDIAAQTIRGEKLQFVTYVLGNDGPGFSYRSKFAAMVDIAAYWGIPGTQSAP